MWRTLITCAILSAVAILCIRVPDIDVNKLEYRLRPVFDYGIASWYDYSLDHEDQQCRGFYGPCYSQINDTCASRKYPKGTMLKVSYKKGNVICRVNDYGPKKCEDWTEIEQILMGPCKERILDLSSHAFEQLSPLGPGLITVKIEVYE